ncbi:MAG: GGDEF domain-containing protein [Lachnospiraceae bacterium]|nr:GGDEF domain-containing protein [Lachnospiraceae bacterium]
MEESKFIKKYRKDKTIQLIIFSILEIVALAVLLANENLRTRVYTDSSLRLLCIITYITLMVSFVFILMDFFTLRKVAVDQHDLHKLTYLDNLTGLPNRHSLDIVFRSYNTVDSLENVGCCLLTISNLSEINNLLGRDAGDRTLQFFCSMLENTCDKYGFVGRNGGNEFIIVINNCSLELIEKCYVALDEKLEEYNNQHSEAPIFIKRAHTLNKQEQHSSFSSLLTTTYDKLLEK